ncbi:MAG: pilus assembly PilX family protein, partial [Gammaproteobacteria bacterium]
SLMFLFLMTIIGLNALNSSTSDERMALNTQHQQQVFHAAESAINVAKRDVTTLETAITTGAAPPIDYTGQNYVTANAQVTYVGCGLPGAGFGLGAGGFVNHEFGITGNASLGASSAQATHLQGVDLLAPMAGESC